MTIETGSRPDGQRSPQTLTSGAAPAQPAEGPSRQRSMIIRGIGLGALARYVGSPRFVGFVITGVIGARALASLAQENKTRNTARVVAWDQRRSQRDQRKVDRRQRRAR